MEVVSAPFEDPAGLVSGHAAVVVARDGLDRHLEFEVLRLPGVQKDRLSVGAQGPRGLSELSLRRFAVDLDHFLALDAAGIEDSCPEGDRRVADALHPLALNLKGRIGESEPEGIQYFVPGEGFKISISYINILRVEVPVRVSEVGIRGIIADLFRDRVRQLSAGAHFSRQDIQDTVSALLAALPDVENRGRSIF